MTDRFSGRLSAKRCTEGFDTSTMRFNSQEKATRQPFKATWIHARHARHEAKRDRHAARMQVPVPKQEGRRHPSILCPTIDVS